MKLSLLTTLLIFLCSCASKSNETVADNTLSTAEKADGWQLLFNGKDMSQWRNFKQETISPIWQVKDGMVTMTNKDGNDIMTKKKYGNFVLKLQWKISEAGNSGIFILADEKGKKIWSHAPEIQILDNEKHRDSKILTHHSGSLYDMIASPDSSKKKAGEWNNVKISHDKGHLQVWQNGVQTVDIVIGSADWKKLLAKSKFAKWSGFATNKTGHIGLQDHNDIVSFKNLKIKELD
ncbi:MAG: DUF1080 domain-containing protein [Lentisphaerales bacterium]|nr:DUF1080 domain-containing protein [Lentisphaerales bacterium]